MKKILLTIGLILTLTLSGVTPLLSAGTAYAEDPTTSADSEDGNHNFNNAADRTFNVTGILRDEDNNQNLEYFETDGTGYSPAENFVLRVINYMITIIGSIALLLIVVAGIMMITSPGNENQRSKATEILTASIIGLVLAFSSFIIVNFVQGLFF